MARLRRTPTGGGDVPEKIDTCGAELGFGGGELQVLLVQALEKIGLYSVDMRGGVRVEFDDGVGVGRDAFAAFDETHIILSLRSTSGRGAATLRHGE